MEDENKNEIDTDASAAGAAAAASAAATVATTVKTVVKTKAAAEAAAVAAAVAAAPAAASVSEEKNSWTLNIIRFLVFVTLFLHGGVACGTLRNTAALISLVTPYCARKRWEPFSADRKTGRKTWKTKRKTQESKAENPGKR